MNEYIFYTTEGYTEAPISEVKVDNCQILGCAKGDNAENAKATLLHENPWIGEAGFHCDKIIARQLLTNEQRDDIRVLVDYLWNDEKYSDDNIDKEEMNGHIFTILKRLKSACK